MATDNTLARPLPAAVGCGNALNLAGQNVVFAQHGNNTIWWRLKVTLPYKKHKGADCPFVDDEEKESKRSRIRVGARESTEDSIAGLHFNYAN